MNKLSLFVGGALVGGFIETCFAGRRYRPRPVYGFGTLALASAPNPLSAGIRVAAIELATGVLLNADHKLWDYTSHECNLAGHIAFPETLMFGLCAAGVRKFLEASNGR